MIGAQAPDHHIFAHYHRRWTAQRERIAFRCLKELELFELKDDESKPRNA
jgi:hypothetical protein